MRNLADKKPSVSGHRGRMRKRFLHDYGQAMADYEILEMLLFSAFPRGDTKALAKDLLHEFGSLAGVLNAQSAELGRVAGVGEAAICAIKLTHSANVRLLKEQITKQHIIASWAHLVDYCRAAMGHLKVEQVRL